MSLKHTSTHATRDIIKIQGLYHTHIQCTTQTLHIRYIHWVVTDINGMNLGFVIVFELLRKKKFFIFGGNLEIL